MQFILVSNYSSLSVHNIPQKSFQYTDVILKKHLLLLSIKYVLSKFFRNSFFDEQKV